MHRNSAEAAVLPDEIQPGAGVQAQSGSQRQGDGDLSFAGEGGGLLYLTVGKEL